MITSRKQNSTERLYRIAEEINPPFTMQFIVKGKGVINPNDFSSALKDLQHKNIILTVQLTKKGVLFNGEGIKLFVHHDSNYLNPKITRVPPSPKQPIEIHLFQDNTTTVLFRILHRVMDGMGALIMIKSIFSALRKEDFSIDKRYPSDSEFRKSLEFSLTSRTVSTKLKYYVPLDEAEKLSLVKYDKAINSPSALLGLSIARILNRPCRFMIPVSIRRHGENDNIISNLSLPIYLDVSPRDTLEMVHEKLMRNLKDKEELRPDKLEGWFQLLPNFVVKTYLKRHIKKAKQINKFHLSGYISDLGRIDLNQLSIPGYTVTDFYGIPVSSPLIPISVQTCHHSNGSRIVAITPITNFENQLQDELTAHLASVGDSNYIGKTPINNKLKKIWEEILKIRLEPSLYDVSFSDLGGESIQLLFILDESEKAFPMVKIKLSNLITQRGGSISLLEMSHIISEAS